MRRGSKVKGLAMFIDTLRNGYDFIVYHNEEDLFRSNAEIRSLTILEARDLVKSGKLWLVRRYKNNNRRRV